MKKPLLIGAAALLFSLYAAAAEPYSEAAEQAGNEIAVFYKNPSDTRAADLLHRLTQAGLKRNTVVVWGTQALQKYPEGSAIWCSNVRTYQEDDKTFAAYTLALTGTPQAQACFDSLTLDPELKTELKKLTPLDPLKNPIRSPSGLDFHWATYFATGNPKAVERIIDYITAAEKFAAQHPNVTDLTHAAAVWSARSNMKQDPAIDRIVRAYIKKQAPTDKKRLETALLKPQTAQDS